jgi:hypothetical protein
MRWICQLPREMQSSRGKYRSTNRRRRSLRYSDPNGVTLAQMTEYACTTDAQLRLTLSNLKIHTPRKISLTGFLMQAIMMVCNFLT